MHQGQPPSDLSGINDKPLILPLSGIKANALPLAGGKAANLGELIQAGFPVPDGFCLTTAAYDQFIAQIRLEPILDQIAATSIDQLAELAEAVRVEFLKVAVPERITAEIRQAYEDLSKNQPIPVAIRSSATAEDLPSASFAGQQDTYLNVVGLDAVLEAVHRCWASLWTDRAVAYRASQGIEHEAVRLAVIVQRLVDAEVAGVLFTANPLTGRRRQGVINASLGLGEAVVSGLVNPDRFVVNLPGGEIVERRLGDKRLRVRALPGGGVEQEAVALPAESFSLTDEQVVALVKLGKQVEAHFGAPQDIEWAIDAEKQIWLLQARPITTLFPLPPDAPHSDQELRVYLSFNVQQGSYKPFTPMGIAATRLLASSIMAFAGFPVSSPLDGPAFVKDIASRVYLDVTSPLRSTFGRTLLIRMMAQAEAHAGAVFGQLIEDPRLSLHSVPLSRLIRPLGRFLIRTRAAWYLPQTLAAPKRGYARLLRIEQTVRDSGKVQPDASTRDCLEAVESLLTTTIPLFLPAVLPVMLGGIASIGLAGKLLGDKATASELQIVLRGLPFNPTTEMTLALWALAQRVQADSALVNLVQNTPADRLAENYLHGKLPSVLQGGLAEFLAVHGHRSVNELDLGAPRWSEHPAYLFDMLASYVELRDLESTPDVQYERAAVGAEAMMRELIRRATRQNWLRGALVRFFLTRARALGGVREMPRYLLALMLAKAQAYLYPVGQALVEAQALEAPEDIFFLSLREAQAALSGTNYRLIVRSRRSVYEQELKRRHVPLVLLSDGTEPAIAPKHTGVSEDTLQGVPASPGVATARAQVILDPLGAGLAPGDILVAPSTDPGWTPLFLMAGGLVMETGGEMSHGAIVAREYSIPAVVGAVGAVERIRTGQRITVDGTIGLVHLHNQ
ncbi:MAG: phosphoenolpyruvate synthase [Chloroflexi bacterium]|nr:phosphoenolpyruvate synthase [Chloroflexota bacterium]MCI0579000.1 phosphoenolpyruvate synthase [Chloroflexota bacterium]MCI0644787.1 phosphoenolpyruvate synthase [Chloroflexota bacterium]MCI0731962.1 phosphoenolpyruvate synthase [Chloroflexota bacterium]